MSQETSWKAMPCYRRI